MENPRPRGTIRSGTFLLAAAVGLISLTALWFWVFVFAPKATAWHMDLAGRTDLPPFVSSMLSVSQDGAALFWPAVGLFVVLSLGGLTPKLPHPICSISRGTCIAMAMLLFVYMAALSVAVGIANLQAYAVQSHMKRVYASSLEEFALRETAENRYEEFQARLTSLGALQTQQIRSASELSRGDQLLRIAQIQRLLEGTASPDLKKQLLATSLMFRETISTNRTKAGAFLKAANGMGVGAFTSVVEFFDWLEPRMNTEGWNPLPLYAITPNRKPGI